MSYYILLKEVPNGSMGAIFREAGNGTDYVAVNNKGVCLSFPKESVENNPKWFRKWEPIEKPPIGIIPEWLWEEQRLSEIHNAVTRYREAGKEIPQQWEDEINYRVASIKRLKK